MRRLLPVLLALLNGLCQAGEIVTFTPGKPLPAPVLEHVAVRAVVAEFVDPDQSGLGKELSFLLWREVLSAISDQRGAGVIIARTPGGTRVSDLLKTDYHEAALRIAMAQGARMAVWGAIDEEGGALHIATYLSMLGDTRDAELALRIRTSSRGDTGLGVRITRTKFNFPVVRRKREELFSRWVVSRPGARMWSAPGTGPSVAVAPGTALQGIGMREEWMVVQLAGGRTGYIKVGEVDLPPATVAVDAGQSLWAEPRADSARIGRTESMTASVVDQRWVAGRGLWYRVSFGARAGWIQAGLVQPTYLLPMVHFVAGLYRYQLGRWDDAVREFERYVNSPEARDDNASLSTAYQLIGASRLMRASAQKNGDASLAKGWEDDFARALQYTPYDPAIYTLRAVAQTAARRSLEGVGVDLDKALELDPGNRDAREVAGRIDAFVRGRDSTLQSLGLSTGDLQRRQVMQLTEKYRILATPK